MIEINILSAFFYSEYARVFLNSTNPDWFTTPLYKKVVRALKQMDRSGDTISINAVMNLFPKNKIELSKVYTAMVTDKTVEHDLKILEYKYKEKRINQRVAEISKVQDLKTMQSLLTEILEESKIKAGNESTEIVMVAGKVLDNIEEAIDRGSKLQGISTGWRYLDKYIGGYHAGNMIVLGGRPGAGKSALGLSLAIECCKWAKTLFVTLEMSKEELAQRYISYFAEVENYKIRNANITKQDIEDIATQMYANPHEISLIDTPDRDLESLITKIKLHKAKHGLNVVFIDYLQLINAEGQSRYEKVSEASKRLKQLAKEINITVIALAQLRREDKSNVKPTLSDLKESGQIEQDADVVLFPYRPQYYSDHREDVEMDAELLIQKNRHGQCAAIPCSFEGKFTRYRELL